MRGLFVFRNITYKIMYITTPISYTIKTINIKTMRFWVSLVQPGLLCTLSALNWADRVSPWSLQAFVSLGCP